MPKALIIWIILISFLTSCSIETTTEDSNRYEIVTTNEHSQPILLDKRTWDSWTATQRIITSENASQYHWFKNIKH